MTSSMVRGPVWAKWWLRAAGVYNLVWGGAVIAFPHALFDLTGLERMRYPEIWQCVGMIVGVYGIGYLIAATDPRRHWPIVLVGLLGKVFGPIGFALALVEGVFPPVFGLTILTNDLIWWVPFALMLWDAARSRDDSDAPAPDLAEALGEARDQRGQTLSALSDASPVLTVFLRHAGCTFCREALDDLRRHREAIQAQGGRICVVTMSDEASNIALARRYSLEDASWISDPDRHLYRAFRLSRGTFAQLFGLSVWTRGVAALARGHGIGKLEGDGFQMPGAFVVLRGRVVREFRHRSAADRPDYGALVCELPG